MTESRRRPAAPLPQSLDHALNDSHLKSTFRHAAIYGLGIVLSRLIGFIMIPIYTRILTPADYGILEILSISTDVVSMLTGLGLAAALTRFYYHYEDPLQRCEVVSSAIITLAFMFGLVTILLLPFAGFLSALLLTTSDLSDLVRLALVSLFASSLIELPVAYLRAQQLSRQAVLVGVARLSLSLGLNILLVVFLGMGVAGVLYSTIITSSLVGLSLTAATLRQVGLRPRASVVKQLVRYGLPMIAWLLGGLVIHYSDRYFLRAYDTLANIGIYSVACRFAMLLPIFVAAPFMQIWGAKTLEIHKTDGAAAPSVFREILGYYNVAVVAGALAISLFAGDLIRLVVGRSFHSAAAPIPLLCVGMVFLCYRQISQLGATIRFRSDLIGLSTVLAAMLAILLNFVLIPAWGIMGAAAATALAFLGEYLLMDGLSRRVYAPICPISEVLRPLFLAGSVFGVVLLLLPSDVQPFLALGAKLVAFAAFVALLPVAGGLSANQRRTLVRAARNPVWAIRALAEARHGSMPASAGPSPVGGLSSRSG